MVSTVRIRRLSGSCVLSVYHLLTRRDQLANLATDGTILRQCLLVGDTRPICGHRQPRASAIHNRRPAVDRVGKSYLSHCSRHRASASVSAFGIPGSYDGHRSRSRFKQRHRCVSFIPCGVVVSRSRGFCPALATFSICVLGLGDAGIRQLHPHRHAFLGRRAGWVSFIPND